MNLEITNVELIRLMHENHKVLWEFRRWFSGYWSTPDRIAAAHYMEIEASEALDAWLKEEHPHHARNNPSDKNSVADECADTLMMALTVLGDSTPQRWELPPPQCLGMIELNKAVRLVWLQACNSDDLYYTRRAAAISAVNMLASGGNADSMKKRLRRIFYKHWHHEVKLFHPQKMSPVAFQKELMKLRKETNVHNADIHYAEALKKAEGDMTRILQLPALHHLDILVL